VCDTYIAHVGNAESVSWFNEDRVCRFLGEVLLKPVGRFNFREFMTAWQASVPEGM